MHLESGHRYNRFLFLIHSQISRIDSTTARLDGCMPCFYYIPHSNCDMSDGGNVQLGPLVFQGLW